MMHLPDDLTGMKILIVDDDKKLCRLMADYLGPMGYHVDAAHNGMQGLEMILGGGYHAVILDVHDAGDGRAGNAAAGAPGVRHTDPDAHGAGRGNRPHRGP